MELHPFLLIFELREAVDALERTLLTRLDADDWPRLTINQVLLFAHLEPDGVTPAELARRMGMSRQSMQKNLDRLSELGLVSVQPHPQDRRSNLVTTTAAGKAFSHSAAQFLDGVERRLEAAFGTEAVNHARHMLTDGMNHILRSAQKANGS